MFDGTADNAGESSMNFSFGGDMALDQPSSNYSKSQARQSPYTGHNQGNADTRQSGNSSGAPIRYDQFYDSPDPQKWRNRAIPESNWQNHDNNQNQNPSSGSIRHVNFEPNTSHSSSQNRVPRSSPKTNPQRNSSGHESNDRYSTSVRSNNSHIVNAANRTSPNPAWIQPQEPPAQAAPAVVINVSHGTPQPAKFPSPASNQVISIENAKAQGWQNSTQPEKIDEYLAGTNRSPEGSNQSRVSKQSNYSQVWPTQNYDQPNDNSDQKDDAYQWHNTPGHEEVNEAQWPAVEDIHGANGEHGVSDYRNDNHSWENNIVGSQPLETSSMEAQNNSNERSSNGNNNVSNHIPWDAEIGNRQAPYENSSASVHPNPQAQVPQQHSSRSSYKSTFSKPTGGNDALNSQYPGTNNNEVPQYFAPQPWTEHAVEPKNHISGSPLPPAPHINGSTLPIIIDPRPRPHWSNWKPSPRSSSFAKAVVPRVEAAEPLYYVPSEVAQRNKMSHQVYLSQPAEYVHKRASPRYLDDFSRPYAVFIFKYRSRGNVAGSKYS